MTIILLLICSYTAFASCWVFRYDDFWAMDSLEMEMLHIFSKNDVPLNIAVIPTLVNHGDTTQIPYVKMLQNQGMVEICQHGYQHIKSSDIGEFYGIDSVTQARWLNEGKKLIKESFDVDVRTFIAPWNVYDSTTLHILSQLNMFILSNAPNKLMDDKSLSYYPCTIFSLSELYNQVSNITHSQGGVIVVMFHRYDFNGKMTMTKLDEILQMLRDKQQDFYTFSAISKQQPFSCVDIKANEERNLLTKIVPSLKLDFALYNRTYIYRMRIYNEMLHILVLLIISMIGFQLLKKNKQFYLVVQFAIMTLCLCSTWFHWITPIKNVCLYIGLSLVILIVFVFREVSVKGNE